MTDTTNDTAAQPVTGTERITAIDTLRGVAVLGILVMNIYAFAMPFLAYSNPLTMGGLEWYNLGTWFFTHVFFDQKFMTVFSLLFGGGMVLMWQRAEEKNAKFGSIYYRRQFWLLRQRMMRRLPRKQLWLKLTVATTIPTMFATKQARSAIYAKIWSWPERPMRTMRPSKWIWTK